VENRQALLLGGIAARIHHFGKPILLSFFMEFVPWELDAFSNIGL
jgi:hypothetical protein